MIKPKSGTMHGKCPDSDFHFFASIQDPTTTPPTDYSWTLGNPSASVEPSLSAFRAHPPAHGPCMTSNEIETPSKVALRKHRGLVFVEGFLQLVSGCHEDIPSLADIGLQSCCEIWRPQRSETLGFRVVSGINTRFKSQGLAVGRMMFHVLQCPQLH